MNEEFDLEQMLARSTPLPCTVDSMQLMFAAGVEQQKKKTNGNRALMIFVSVTSGLFLLSTLTLSYWLFSLSQENKHLVAEINQSRNTSENGQSENGQSKQFHPQHILTQQATHTDKPDSNLDHPDDKPSRESWATRSVNKWEFGNPANRSYLLRGVALRPADEYRNPVESFGIPTSSSSFGFGDGSTQSNLELRNQLQGVFLGL